MIKYQIIYISLQMFRIGSKIIHLIMNLHPINYVFLTNY